MRRYAYYITREDFGHDIPANWADIADKLNDKIDELIDAEIGCSHIGSGDIDPDTEEMLAADIRQLWKDYHNGYVKDVPNAIYED